MIDQDIGCGCETITVPGVSADQEEGYEGLLLKAMTRMQDFDPTASVLRTWKEAQTAQEARVAAAMSRVNVWYLSCVHASVSAHGAMIEGTFTFVLYQGDEVDS